MGRRRAQIRVLSVAQRVALAGEPVRQVVITIDDPGIAGFAGEQRELADGDDAAIVVILTPGLDRRAAMVNVLFPLGLTLHSRHGGERQRFRATGCRSRATV